MRHSDRFIVMRSWDGDGYYVYLDRVEWQRCVAWKPTERQARDYVRTAAHQRTDVQMGGELK